jgi:hypothetical protein
MTPFSSDYHERLYARAMELAQQTQLQAFCKTLKEDGLTPMEIDIEVFFALIHDGYRTRCLEEKLWEDGNWDFEI